MYSGFAYVYDRLMRETDYRGLVGYYQQLFARFGVSPRLGLDLGCGTGSTTVELSKMGCEMTGIDLSDDMLALASEKALQAGQDILFLNQDMTAFELYGTVDFAVSSFDCLNYITDKRRLKKVFSLVNTYLNPRGLFIFDLNTRYKLETVLSKNTFILDEEDIYYVWRSAFDARSQLCDFSLTLFDRKGGLWQRIDEEQTQRAYSAEEIKALLEAGGLEFCGVFDDRSLAPPREKSERLFFVARERGKAL